jgi:tetratricopeptide (TPR) repeat protein
MKKFTIILLFIFGFTLTQAQTGTVNFDQLKKKVEKSNADIENPKKNIKEGTWIDRAELMIEVYDSQMYNYTQGLDLTAFKLLLGSQLKNSVQEEQEGVLVDKLVTERAIFYFVNSALERWEVLNPVVAKPLDIAFESLKKVQEIDVQGKKNKKLFELYTTLIRMYIADGSSCYSSKNFDCAYSCFSNVLTIGQLPVVHRKDTAMYYYTALAAYFAGKNQEAIVNYKKAIELGFTSEGNAYANIDQSFKALGDKESGLTYLEEGFMKFPKNQNVLIALINYYLNKNEDPSKILSYIDKAIQDAPLNASLYFNKAALYDKLNDFDNAAVTYQKALECDPNYFDAYFNLGALYYNKGVKYLEEANKVPAKELEKYDGLIAKANDEFKRSIPFIEKAHQLSPGDKSTVETLKNIYFRYRLESEEMSKKFNEFNELLQNMK